MSATVILLASSAAGQTAPWLSQGTTGSVTNFHVPGPGQTRLIVESEGLPQRVVVEQREETPRGPRVLGAGTCETPCVLYVPRTPLTLRAEARRLRDTELTLEAIERPSTLRLRAASRAQWNLGVGLTGIGATVFFALVGYALAAQNTSAPALSTEATLGGTLASVALIAAGIPLLVLNRTGIASLTRD